MVSTDFSQAIVEGMRRRGLRRESVAEAIGVSLAKADAIAAGRGRLTDGQLRRIEEATGVTVGQLAALAIEPKGGAFTELANEWAKVAALRAPAKRVAKRA